MAPILINRAPWNALIDDSGGNLDGTPWTKAQIKSVLLDPIDVALADVDDGTTKDAAQDTLITANAAAIAALSPAAGQIKFPAAQNPSVDPNTLDDYEEGTWTPTDVSGGSLVLTALSGRYTKVGRLVTVTGSLTYPSTSNGAQAWLGGLPFGIAAGANADTASFFTNASLALCLLAIAGGVSFQVYVNTGAPVANSALSAKVLSFSMTYHAS